MAWSYRILGAFWRKPLISHENSSAHVCNGREVSGPYRTLASTAVPPPARWYRLKCLICRCLGHRFDWEEDPVTALKRVSDKVQFALSIPECTTGPAPDFAMVDQVRERDYDATVEVLGHCRRCGVPSEVTVKWYKRPGDFGGTVPAVGQPRVTNTCSQGGNDA
jgi:hypothetical protein